MKRLLISGLVALGLGGCVVLPVEGPGYGPHRHEYRGYGHGYSGWHPVAPYYERRNAGYRR